MFQKRLAQFVPTRTTAKTITNRQAQRLLVGHCSAEKRRNFLNQLFMIVGALVPRHRPLECRRYGLEEVDVGVGQLEAVLPGPDLVLGTTGGEEVAEELGEAGDLLGALLDREFAEGGGEGRNVK
ncbi:unnamed protein product [Linum trigynum]|uniref:Uncharacterized protein n=1 Tax=Linum trigynum TaxID=586398 RepID=A0AAV2DNB5_9ROSI